MPEDLVKWDNLLPMMDVWLEVEHSEIHYVASIIPTLKVINLSDVFGNEDETDKFVTR